MIDFGYCTLAAIRGWHAEPEKTVRDIICNELARALQHYYVHLPQKRSSLAVEPVQALTILRTSNEYNFSKRLLGIVQALKDRHTTISLPQPWQGATAYVPFMIERYTTNGEPTYIVTKQFFGYTSVPLGACITHWNGVPIDLYVAALAAQTNGANEASRLRLAIVNLTQRPLAFSPIPIEDWVTLTYLHSGELRSISTPWYCAYGVPLNSAPTLVRDGYGAALQGADYQLLHTNDFLQRVPKVSAEPVFELITDGNLRYGKIETTTGPVGYVRIFSFDVSDDVAFVIKMASILASLPQDMLIIDIRNNPGGLIPAGQKLLRVLTAKPLLPSPVEFRCTDCTLKLTQLEEFRIWRRSIELRTLTGLDYSQAYALSSYDNLPAYRYPGKIALVVDALAYSTSDFFAADFADNGVGLVVGVDPATGGGGANVFAWNELVSWSDAVDGGLSQLPGGFTVTIAGRRSLRTGFNAGIPIEGFGVEVDVQCELTRNDLLNANVDLINFTAAALRNAPVRYS
ncbi:S41 family peptidase [Bradyrhizobium sp. Tv2a-2]|uniref:S41 family peptidase n=1 Tax=Bradyrhizobium sp. Tv2a-2 TaxID=113395 RepID=UPI000465EB6C|nr:S41 family peptidase [Bradyrhizobium sp. Tv2a-2]